MLTPTSGARSRPSPQNCWEEVLIDAEHASRLSPSSDRDPAKRPPASSRAHELAPPAAPSRPSRRRRKRPTGASRGARALSRAAPRGTVRRKRRPSRRPCERRRPGRGQTRRSRRERPNGLLSARAAPYRRFDDRPRSSPPANRPHRADDLSLRRRTSPCAQRRCAARARPEPARRGATALPRERSCLRPRDRRPRRASAGYIGSAMELDILFAGGAPPSIGGGEGEHSLHIPGHGYEAPLAAHFFQPAQ